MLSLAIRTAISLPDPIFKDVKSLAKQLGVSRSKLYILLPKVTTGLPKDSVANVSQVFTVDKKFLVERIGMLPESLQKEVDEGLRVVLFL